MLLIQGPACTQSLYSQTFLTISWWECRQLGSSHPCETPHFLLFQRNDARTPIRSEGVTSLLPGSCSGVNNVGAGSDAVSWSCHWWSCVYEVYMEVPTMSLQAPLQLIPLLPHPPLFLSVPCRTRAFHSRWAVAKGTFETPWAFLPITTAHAKALPQPTAHLCIKMKSTEDCRSEWGAQWPHTASSPLSFPAQEIVHTIPRHGDVSLSHIQHSPGSGCSVPPWVGSHLAADGWGTWTP